MPIPETYSQTNHGLKVVDCVLEKIRQRARKLFINASKPSVGEIATRIGVSRELVAAWCDEGLWREERARVREERRLGSSVADIPTVGSIAKKAALTCEGLLTLLGEAIQVEMPKTIGAQDINAYVSALDRLPRIYQRLWEIARDNG